MNIYLPDIAIITIGQYLNKNQRLSFWIYFYDFDRLQVYQTLLYNDSNVYALMASTNIRQPAPIPASIARIQNANAKW